MNNRRVNLLWFDDEFGTDRERLLWIWLQWLRGAEGRGLIALRCCNSLGDFARSLREGSGPGREQGRVLFDLLIIDVMLNDEHDETFESLGFPDEQVTKMDAGAQIAGLLRNSTFDDVRPDWLSDYVKVPVCLLSSSPLLQDVTRQHVGHRRMAGVELIAKSLQRDPDRIGISPMVDFVSLMERLFSELVVVR